MEVVGEGVHRFKEGLGVFAEDEGFFGIGKGAVVHLFEEAGLGQEGVVGAEEDFFGSDDAGDGFEYVGGVEEGRGGGVEVDVFEGLADFGHEGVEGEAAAPVGADDLVAGEVLDEGHELVGGGLTLARVAVADGFGTVHQDDESHFAGNVHHWRHHIVISNVEILCVGVKFADAAGATGSASFYLAQGVVAPGGVDGAEGDETSVAGGCGAQEVAVGFAGDVRVGPAKAEDYGRRLRLTFPSRLRFRGRRRFWPWGC